LRFEPLRAAGRAIAACEHRLLVVSMPSRRKRSRLGAGELCRAPAAGT
jgi:hypothetical protein